MGHPPMLGMNVVKNALNELLEKHYGRPPTESQSEEAMRNLMGFVNALKKASAEIANEDEKADRQ